MKEFRFYQRPASVATKPRAGTDVGWAPLAIGHGTQHRFRVDRNERGAAMSPTMRTVGRSFAASLAVLLIVGTTGPASPAPGEEWPQRPVKIIVPFPPGGMIDGTARIVAQRLGQAFGKQFVVENRPGASGTLAAEAVVRAPADGYTLFVAALPQIAILPALSKPSYDPVGDFAPISKIATSPFVLVVNPNFPAKTLSEFV